MQQVCGVRVMQIEMQYACWIHAKEADTLARLSRSIVCSYLANGALLISPASQAYKPDGYACLLAYSE